MGWIFIPACLSIALPFHDRWARRVAAHGRLGKAPQVVVASAVHGMRLNDAFHALGADVDFGRHGFDGFRAVKARAKARARAMQVSLDTAKDAPVSFDEATKITARRPFAAEHSRTLNTLHVTAMPWDLSLSLSEICKNFDRSCASGAARAGCRTRARSRSCWRGSRRPCRRSTTRASRARRRPRRTRSCGCSSERQRVESPWGSL